MFLRFKIWLKEKLPAVYGPIRKALFPIFFKWRSKKMAGFTEPTFKEVNMFGFSFQILLDPKNGFVDQEIFWKGVYEEDILKLYAKELKAGDAYLDIGANIGQHALFAAAVVGNTGTVQACEPIQAIYNQFSLSVTKNNFTNIKLHNVGCSDKAEEKQIYKWDANAGGSSLKPIEGREYNTETIKLVTGDSLFGDLAKVSFIKIDTEGYEYEALTGLVETIGRHHPKMLIEYSPIFYKNGEGIEILSFLKKHGYHMLDIETGKTVTDIDSYASHFTKDQTNLWCTKQ